MSSPQLPGPIRRWLGTEGPWLRGPHRHLDTTSVAMIKVMVREGDAVSLVHPSTVHSELESGKFVAIQFDAPPLFFGAGLVWLADRFLSPTGAASARKRDLFRSQ